MKQLKKVMIAVVCFGVILGTTACGTMDNNQNNDVTEGKQDTTDNGVIDDVGDATGNVINDIGNGVENITNDVTGNDTTTR